LGQLWRWLKQGLDINVTVNISARNLLNTDIVTKIKTLFFRYHLSLYCLDLEISESSIMKNTDYSLQVLKEVNDVDIDLAVDDYGTGCLSLAYLKKLPVK
jgi:EAL domain-containing protein (putative c-di-GMP-specific phosphodiesterase class I)